MSDSPHPLEHLAAAGPWDGPSYQYRGAEIHCLPGGNVCGLKVPGHPLNGDTFGVPGTITPAGQRLARRGATAEAPADFANAVTSPAR